MKKHISIFTILIVSVFSIASLSMKPYESQNKELNTDVSFTIDSQASGKDLEEIQGMLKQQGVSVKFSSVKRNNEGEITAIRIELSNTEDNQTTISNIQGFAPISKISFGIKNRLLFINQEHGDNAFMFLNHGNGFTGMTTDIDSLINNFMSFKNKNSFHFFDEDSLILNGKNFDFEAFKKRVEKMKEQMGDEENGVIVKKFIFEDSDSEEQGEHAYAMKKKQKFHFIDNPDVDKLIVIDGKEADFKTLDKLAQENKLANVDFLKPDTAISVYGKKAKDGAVIATTKK